MASNQIVNTLAQQQHRVPVASDSQPSDRDSSDSRARINPSLAPRCSRILHRCIPASTIYLQAAELPTKPPHLPMKVPIQAAKKSNTP